MRDRNQTKHTMKKLKIEVMAENPEIAKAVADRFNSEGFDATPVATESLDHSKAYASQKRWIKKNYGEAASKGANYGWVAGSDSYTTKMYGHGVVTTTRVGGKYVHTLEK